MKYTPPKKDMRLFPETMPKKLGFRIDSGKDNIHNQTLSFFVGTLPLINQII